MVLPSGYSIIIMVFGKNLKKYNSKSSEGWREDFVYVLGSICWMITITVGVMIYFD